METLKETTAQLALHCNQQWPHILNMRKSDANGLFKSKAFEDWQKGRDNEIKIQVGIIDHLQALIKSMNARGKRR